MNKTALGKHWFNNGESEGYFTDCPEGWSKGRLPIKDGTRQKHIDNNGMHNMTDEQLAARSEKLSIYHQNMSIEAKISLSENISKNRKGKGLGRKPWNKNVQGKQIAWNKGITVSEEHKEYLRQAYLNLTEEEKLKRRQAVSNAHKGKDAWNKGKILGEWSENRIKDFLSKQNVTKTKNQSYNTSKPEEEYYIYLTSKYGEENVVRQYSDERYPYACDFYIKDLDLFIELNLSWTHGGHPFDASSTQDQLLLERWRDKSQTSDFYKNAIHTWTELDVKKQKLAQTNNLNYRIIYSKGEMYE